MDNPELRKDFHEQVTKPIARFLRDYPRDLNDALALRIAFAMALAHEKHLDGTSDGLHEYLRVMARR